jgi:plastocyanin
MKFPPILVFLTVFGASLATSAASFDVSQKGRRFDPDTIDIKVGDTLLIHNDDEFTHHVYVNSANFNYDSADQPPGKTLTVTFPQAGDYTVRCEIHPKMRLVVHVKDASP